MKERQDIVDIRFLKHIMFSENLYRTRMYIGIGEAKKKHKRQTTKLLMSMTIPDALNITSAKDHKLILMPLM